MGWTPLTTNGPRSRRFPLPRERPVHTGAGKARHVLHRLRVGRHCIRQAMQGLHSDPTGTRFRCIPTQALSPTAAQSAQRNTSLQLVQAALASVGEVAPFGSWVSGLHTPAGDLDLFLDEELSWWVAGGAEPAGRL